MSTTPLMHSNTMSNGIPYIMNGIVDKYRKDILQNTVGVVLIHDVHNHDISMNHALRLYCSFGLNKILCVNSDGSTIDKKTQECFPLVQFLSLEKYASNNKKSVSLGKLINIAFQTIKTDLIFLSWTDIDPYGMSSRLLQNTIGEFPLCVVPVFETPQGHITPTTYRPKYKMGKFSVEVNKKNPMLPYTFIPHDYVGIFNRNIFLELGGFDTNFLDPWWQLLEFGMHVYSKGFHIRLSPYYRVRRNNAYNQIVANTSERYHNLLCVKASIGNKMLHELGFIVSNLNTVKSSIKLMKDISKQNTHYKSNLKHKIRSYWPS